MATQVTEAHVQQFDERGFFVLERCIPEPSLQV
jgi:hypothetical protein